MKNGLKTLTKFSPEEKIKQLERELIIERRGRFNDNVFHDEEYSIISSAYLELCDSDYCEGDLSVGDRPCEFYNDELKICKLKRFLGIENEEECD